MSDNNSLRMPADYDCRYAWPPVWFFVTPGMAAPINRTMLFDTKEAAVAAHAATHGASGVNQMSVRRREIQAGWDGHHNDLAWSHESWWDDSPVSAYTFPKANPDPSYLSVYANERDAARGKRTTVRVGRFLADNFPHMSERERLLKTEWQIASRSKNVFHDPEKFPLHYATTPDEIVDVYLNGPPSCMDHRHFTRDKNPTRAYGAGDLAVAFVRNSPEHGPKKGAGRIGIIARCLVWPEKKVFSRIYPTNGSGWAEAGYNNPEEAARMERALKDRFNEAGWQSGGTRPGLFDGARLAMFSAGKGLAMFPYLDQNLRAVPSKDGFVIDAKNGFLGQVQVGHIYDPRVTWARGEPRPPGDLPHVECCNRCKRPRGEGGEVFISPTTKSRWCDDCMNTRAYRMPDGSRIGDQDGNDHVRVYRTYRDYTREQGSFLAPHWWVAINAQKCEATRFHFIKGEGGVPFITTEDGVVLCREYAEANLSKTSDGKFFFNPRKRETHEAILRDKRIAEERAAAAEAARKKAAKDAEALREKAAKDAEALREKTAKDAVFASKAAALDLQAGVDRVTAQRVRRVTEELRLQRAAIEADTPVVPPPYMFEDVEGERLELED